MAEQRKFLEAKWISNERGVVFLVKNWKVASEPPPIFLDPGKEKLKSISAAKPADYGKLSGYYSDEKGTITFLLCPDLYHNFDPEDRFYVAGNFNDWNPEKGSSNWRLREVVVDDTICFGLTVSVRKVSKTKKPWHFKFVSNTGEWLEVPGNAPNRVKTKDGNCNYEICQDRTGRHMFYFEPFERHPILGREELVWFDRRPKETCPIAYGEQLERLYSDKALGAFVRYEQTLFRLFAPRAKSVSVIVTDTLDDPNPKILDMVRTDESVWERVYPESLAGHYYHYSVDGENADAFSHFDKNFKVVDPYAKALVSREGPGIIVEEERLFARESSFQPPCWHDLVLIETHVRDLLEQAPYPLSENERQGFSGLARWLRSGECYLTELGVNAVELQPIQEFDNRSRDEYHWGYMTCNYFSPESSYALNPEVGSQIEEFKDLVDAFHENDLAVILDVVYNHVGEPNHLLFIDKQYYFETNHKGDLMNWSGCGNDLKCHAPMAKRMIIDSLIHLIQVYDVDGFRFDLAELIGVDVLRDIEKALKEVKPSIILIAEPWSFRGHISHALRHTGWSSWNDGYRDFILKYVKGEGNLQGIQYFMSGSPHHFAMFPAQTVNYTESHDDRCWMDRLTEHSDFNGSIPTQNDRRRSHLMCAILMSSLGIPMLAEGQDMLRSKQGINNTYKRGDVNALNYGRMNDYPMTHEYFASWIRFRLSEHGRFLRLPKRQSDQYLKFLTSDESSAIGILFNADKSIGEGQLFFVVNPQYHPLSLKLDGLDLSCFLQIADHERFDSEGVSKPHFEVSDAVLHMPGLSCGLWLND